MYRQLRLLLTSRCSARCAYCHNEGQRNEAGYLPFAVIEKHFATWQAAAMRFDEVVLSGGEPTLHPQIALIAQLCRAAGGKVSINTNGAHPRRLEAALPWLDEVKIHLDSFDAKQQYAAMAIPLERTLATVAVVQRHHVPLLLNHPIGSAEESLAFVEAAACRGLDCKLIALLGQSLPEALVQSLRTKGYVEEAPNEWRQSISGHRVMLRTCQPGSNRQTIFVDANGVRLGLEAD